MTQHWNFEIKDPEFTIEFEVKADESIDVTSGHINQIFKSADSMHKLALIIPQLVRLMQINTITKVKIKEVED